MPAIIELKKVSFSYEKTPTLKEVDLSISQGEMIAVIGPNGGGKTTLLKLITGLLQPTQGSVFIFGKAPYLSCTRFGYVPQATHFDVQFPITVLELVLMGILSQISWYGKFSKKAVSSAMHALDQVGLLGLEKEAFGSLSGGQAQRTLIARAIVGDPDILLLDEPTASVDPLVRKEILTFILGLKGKKNIIMVTHDLQTVSEDVDRVLCVSGNVSELTPSQLCAHYPLGLYHSPLSLKKEDVK
jgi:zinc transport system ATP-binding protein